MKKIRSFRLLVISVLISSLLMPQPAQAETWWQGFNKKTIALISAGVGALALGYWWFYGNKKKPNNPKTNQPSYGLDSHKVKPADMITLDPAAPEGTQHIVTSAGDSEQIPKTKIASPSGKMILSERKNDFVEWGVSSAQGGEAEQQDRFAVDISNPSLEFFAVFDGTNGSAVAEQLKNDLSKTFFKYKKRGISTIDALSKAFHNMDKKLAKFKDQGATATVFIIDGNEGYFAQLGDTKGFLIRDTSKISDTPTHIKESPEGSNSWVYSKSFGNYANKEKTANLPDIFKFGLVKGDIILLVNRSMLSLSRETIASLVNASFNIKETPKQTADLLVNQVINRQKNIDAPSLNTTALIIKINEVPPTSYKAPLPYSIARPKRKDPKTGNMTAQNYRYTLYKQQGDLIFFGLYEGIGGVDVASLVRSFLYQRFFEHVKTLSIQEAILKAFEEVDDQIKKKGIKFDKDLPDGLVNTFNCIGSTAAVCIIDTESKKAYCATLGTTAIHLFGKKDSGEKPILKQISTPDITGNEESLITSKQCKQGIRLTRAFGMYGYKPPLKSIPTIRELRIKKEDKILVISSSIDTMMRNREGGIIVEALPSDRPAQSLVQQALPYSHFQTMASDLIEKTTALVITIN